MPRELPFTGSRRIEDILGRESMYGKPGEDLYDVCEAMKKIEWELEAISCKGGCDCPCSRDAKDDALRLLGLFHEEWREIRLKELQESQRAIWGSKS